MQKPTDVEDVEDVVIERGRWKVVFTYLGEGLHGDYDPQDAEDAPLFRADLFVKPKNKREAEDLDTEFPTTDWVGPKDSSYCTSAPTTTPREQLDAGALELIAALEKFGWSRRIMERWTWRSYTGKESDSNSWLRR